jgi:hypothetical protein
MPALSFKARFVPPIQVGLGLVPITPVISDDATSPDGYRLRAAILPKLQTIRAGAPKGRDEAYSHGGRLLARIGAELKLYCGQRTKGCFLIGVGHVTSLHRIVIWPSSMTVLLDGKLLSTGQLRKFVQADGFADALDMRAFWKAEHPNVDKFNGVLIRWRPADGAP